MNKITVCLFTLISICFISYSQIVILEVKNPFPRVGDKFEITYTIVKDTSDNVDMSDFKNYLKKSEENELGRGSLMFTNLISDTGMQTFGPFILTVNNKKITTNTVTIKVEKSLLDETSGIWVRQSSFEGQEYLIIEQRIIKPADSESLDGDFVELADEKIKDGFISFESNFSDRRFNEIEVNGKSQIEGYKVTLYQIYKTDAFKAPFLLNKTNLRNLPKSNVDFKFLIK